MKKLSVIIVSYNVEHFLNLCLQSVQQAIKTIDAEVIVVDNHSNDASCEMVHTLFPEVILVENKVNLGFSKANNQGVSLAKGEYVLILNPDTVLAEDTFEKIISFADKQKKMGALGIQFINGSGIFQAGSKRNFPKIKRVIMKLFFQNSHRNSYYANQIDENNISEVDILVGAFMLLKRTTFIKVGGFDERYFMYGEDIDLSYQLQKNDFKNYYYGAVKAIHFVGESTKKDIKYLKYFYGAMRLFYRKNFNINKFFDVFMSIGVKFWFWSKYFQLLFLKEKEEIIKRVLYVGANENVFNKLNRIYAESQIFIFPVCTSRVISRLDDLEQLNHLIDEHQIQEVIFDCEVISFSKIIFFMSQLSNKSITFKIKPTLGNYIIGSNFTIGKGVVEKL
ncbi:MAG: glycosyltransferase family 2 protein [Flavobacteriaceae bacterium]|nr:glycosyltransferase family 2 protein [Flavobacteriaceae bacterium]